MKFYLSKEMKKINYTNYIQAIITYSITIDKKYNLLNRAPNLMYLKFTKKKNQNIIRLNSIKLLLFKFQKKWKIKKLFYSTNSKKFFILLHKNIFSDTINNNNIKIMHKSYNNTFNIIFQYSKSDIKL